MQAARDAEDALMGELTGLLLVLLAFFALVGLAWLVAWKLGLLKPGGLSGEEKEGKPEHRYRAQPAVLSDGERAFLPALERALPLLTQAFGARELPRLLAHVRLADVVDPVSSEYAARNAVAMKHVDFLLCDPETTRPLLVIELDDASHAAAKQKKADAVKDHACASAGVPVLRVAAVGGGRYDPGTLARAMAERMGRVGTGATGAAGPAGGRA